MRILLLFLIVASSLVSCKAPLPVYFDKPSGVLVDTFPANMQGNYYLADDIYKRGITSMQEKYIIQDGKVVLKEKDSMQQVIDSVLSYNDKNDTAKTVESVDTTTSIASIEESAVERCKKYTKFNEVQILNVFGPIDSITKNKKIAFAFVKINTKSIYLILCDSVGDNYETELYHLNEKIQLSYYSDDYYLNLKTPFGWEIMQIKIWEKGQQIAFTPFLSSSYDENAAEAKTFVKSTTTIYPKLKPIYDKDHMIVGMKAKMNPKIVKEIFKKMDSMFELLKVD